jgi:2-polyprenyl-6-methoxyphenol hydroxylase-like FAD-dependent oxidoreductase
MKPLRIGVVGAGTGGLVSALLLARDGHDVEVVERVTDPRPIGAGILLQPLGQAVLADLGLADELVRCSTPIRRIDGRTRGGRTVLAFGFADAGRSEVGLGVHRGDLFALLWTAAAVTVSIRSGVPVWDVQHAPDGWRLVTPDGGELGPYDLVVAADGARSRVRHRLGLATKDVGYPYGCIWAVVPDPEGLAGDVLWQRYRDTRTTLGILPTGLGQASIFWSSRSRSIDAEVAAGSAAFLDRARPFSGHLGTLVERVADTGILPARYRDVVVPRPIAIRGRHGVVLVGDAAHAMSPQLGMGASLALADAWSLARALRTHPDLPEALHAHATDRRSHVRWYTWLSRLMTPVFQSDLVPMGWARDLMFGPAARIALVRREFATILLGEQTSPWSSWPPAAPGGPLRRPAR